MATYIFNCSQCGKPIEADDAYCGMEAECPYCSNNIIVPEKPKAMHEKTIVAGRWFTSLFSSMKCITHKEFWTLKHSIIVGQSVIVVALAVFVVLLLCGKGNSYSVARTGNGAKSAEQVTTDEGNRQKEKAPARVVPSVIKGSEDNLAEKGEYKIGTYTWSYSVSNGNAIIEKLVPITDNVEIPLKIGRYTVKGIGRSTFSGCTSLTSVKIPNSVKSIGKSAFKGCKSLTSITIPNSVKSIGESAFDGCKSLTSITIPNSVTSIERSTFSDCDGLTSVTIPASVTNIGRCAFSSCKSLTSITIPSSVTSIAGSALNGCTSLTRISVNKGNSAFVFADGLLLSKDRRTLIRSINGNMIIPNTVTSIEESAFDGCEGLTSITIPNSVKSIGKSAFKGCKSLTSITIPNSVKSIGESAFDGCKSLTSITIPNSVTSIERSTFSDCDGLTSVTIPASVTNIGGHAFFSCKSLTSVTIPDSVMSMGDWAFALCGLKNVTIPDSVTTIGKDAFAGCDSLKRVSIPEAFADAIPSVFEGCISISELIDMRKVEGRNSRRLSEYYRKEAERGNVRAQYYIGMYYFEARNMAEAAKWLRMAAEKGHAGAQFELGCCYFIDSSEVDHMFKAMQWWRRAAAKRHYKALFSLDMIPADIRNGRRIIH